MTAENQKKYDAKLKRIQDALALRTPDRVPIDIPGGTFMIQRTGHTLAESNFDETLEIAKEGAKRFMLDFEPDVLKPFADIFEDEEFVLEYCEKFHKEQLEMLRNDNKDGKKTGKFVNMALHKGSDDMMGRNLYRKFYWDHLQEIIKTVHETGMMCDLFCEGEYTKKLDILSEVERCSCYFAFDKIDIAKAKETVGKVCCIGAKEENVERMFKVLHDREKC